MSRRKAMFFKGAGYNPVINDLDDFVYDGASAVLSGANGFCFNSDGSKIYVCSSSIKEYDCTTNYDVTDTLTFSDSYSEPGSGIWINDSDDRLYVSLGNNIREIHMSTPNDLTTASTASTTSFAYTGDDGFRSIQLVNNGYTIIVSNGSSNDGWTQFEIATAYDTSGGYSSYYQSDARVPLNDQFIRAVQYTNDGASICIAGSSSENIVQYGLDAQYDTENYNSQYGSIDMSSHGSGSILTCFMSPDNTKLYAFRDGSDTIYQFIYSP